MIDSDMKRTGMLVDWVRSLNCYNSEEDAKTCTARNEVIRHILEKIESRLSK